MNFDWQFYCSKCNHSCCKGENPYHTIEISNKNNGDCEFLNNKCLFYDNRPFECKIFPLDILEINNELFWVVWKDCPATKNLDLSEMLKSVEKIENHEYILKYVSYHKEKQPEKYKNMTFEIIKKYEKIY